MAVNRSKNSSSTSTTIPALSSNYELILFNHSKEIGNNDMYIYNVKIYSNCTSTTVGTYGTLVAEYVPCGNGFKERISGKQYNAGGTVEAAPSNAKLVSQMYFGVNNVAKKVKRAYIGDSEGKARIFWPSYEYTTFTSASVIPSYWSSGTTSATATNSYGTWTCSVSKSPSSSSTTVGKAFDGSTSTYCYLSGTITGEIVTFTLKCPTNISIAPSAFKITISGQKILNGIFGYAGGTTLCSETTFGGTKDTKTLSCSASSNGNYYTRFEFDIKENSTSSSSYRGIQAYQLDIWGGILRQSFI